MDFTDYLPAFPELKLQRVTLRKLAETDAEDLFAYYNNPNVYRFLDWNGPSSLEKAREAIQFWNRGYQEGWIIRFAIEDRSTRKAIGTIFLNGFDGTRAETGYELSEDYWNKGIMTEALLAVLRLGFDVLRRKRIQATVDEENAASRRLLEKCGFKLEGKLRKYETHSVTGKVKDMLMYSMVEG